MAWEGEARVGDGVKVVVALERAREWGEDGFEVRLNFLTPVC